MIAVVVILVFVETVRFLVKDSAKTLSSIMSSRSCVERQGEYSENFLKGSIVGIVLF